MLLDICLGSKSVWRVLILFSESPGAGFTRKELKEHSRLGNKSLSLALSRLIKFKILREEKKQLPSTIYKLNMDSPYIESLLACLNRERNELNHLPVGISIAIREFCRKVIDETEILELYLFGSVAKKTYREDSDIDLAVVLKEKRPKTDMKINQIAEKISERFRRQIQYFIITPSQIENSKKRTQLTEEILKHGIKIV